MAKLLYIESSPRKERSASIEVAHHFIEAYKAAHPGDTVETIDLWKTELPAFNESAIDAKYAILHGHAFTPEQAASWAQITAIADKFKSADAYLFSVPMWNFGIPYILKHYFDILLQPGLTFTFSPAEGYKGLVTGKPATVIYARGGAYGEGTGAEGYDQQTRYFGQALGFIGFTEVNTVLVEPTLGDKDGALAKGKIKAAEFAAK